MVSATEAEPNDEETCQHTRYILECSSKGAKKDVNAAFLDFSVFVIRKDCRGDDTYHKLMYKNCWSSPLKPSLNKVFTDF